MKRYLKWVAKKTFSAGEREALLALIFEFRVSHFHRQGIRLIRRNSWQRPKRLNLGSGSIRKDGFLNADFFPRGDVTLDLRRGLPFDDNCCEIIFSEHFFEHVDYPISISHLLSECLRVLQPGGTLRFSVPDTEWPILDYKDGDNAPYFQACREHSWWHPSYCTTRMEHINYHFRQGGEHRFAYDFETAKRLLDRVGFQDVSRRAFDPDLDSQHREIGSLFVSAKKPA